MVHRMSDLNINVSFIILPWGQNINLDPTEKNDSDTRELNVFLNYQFVEERDN
jgi:hypothetical protein